MKTDITGNKTAPYFPHTIQIGLHHWRSLDLGTLSQLMAQRSIPDIIFYRQLALRLNRKRPEGSPFVHAGHLNMYATLLKVFRHLIDVLAEAQVPDVLMDALVKAGFSPAEEAVDSAMIRFVRYFPPGNQATGGAQNWLHQGDERDARQRIVLRELLLLRLAAQNPALESFREILADDELTTATIYPRMVTGMERSLAAGKKLPELDMTLDAALRAPILASPDSLAGQVGFIKEHWQNLLPPEMLEELLMAFDILLEEERERSWGSEPGPPPVLDLKGKGGFGHGDGSSIFGGYDYPEYERFSADADWMSNVVLMAKMVYIWLDQISKEYGYPITRLDQVPDAELDRLAGRGFTGLWLIGIWERSPASQRIKQLCGNPDAISSAYSLYDYEIAGDLGGWEALTNLKGRAARRGIRLASDMVPNHTGIYSRWVIQHPDWFVQADYPPFPAYQFNGENLSHSPDHVIQIEDGYWTKTDAAVVFRLIERNTGRTRYIYHGNDGTSFPWNDTAQLNYLLPQVREAVIQTILHVARSFPIIRFDAAMTLAKKHFQRLWFPLRGLGGGIPSRAEHGMSREEFDAVFPVEFWREVVDRVAAEVPDTLLLAEAFWLMEGYFVRTLGMHRVYNSAFMNMLKMEENAKYRQTIRNVLEFNPEVLKRFVNFMNNPDEKTAVEQFGTQGKYFGACVLLSTMPGLPMFGHGQIEGFHEKYGMEYKRAYWDEPVDQGLVQGHERWIFPLLRRRWLFSGSENFALYDFYVDGGVNENVFAYSNRAGDQRGLVLYHNRYERTAGWIRESAAFVAKNGAGEMELRRTTLAEALQIKNDGRIYYAFRDYSQGLWYIRNGRELWEKGLFAELHEFEFHVFMDFRELHDDEENTWGQLCATLNGSGVEDVDQELKQLKYGEVNHALRALMQLAPQPPAPEPGRADMLAPAVEDLFASLARHGCKAGRVTAAFLQALADCLDLPARIAGIKTSSKAVAAYIGSLHDFVGTTVGSKLLLAWQLLRGRGIPLERFGLDTTLRHLFTDSTLYGQPAQGREAVLLLETLLALDTKGKQRPDTPQLLEKAFDLPVGRYFMGVHESGGSEWFNKERFEELTVWLLALNIALAVAPGQTAADFSGLVRKSAAEFEKLADLAGQAGYRVTELRLVLKAALNNGKKMKSALLQEPPSVLKKGKKEKS